MTANELLPAIRSLQHGEKFLLMAVLLGELAREEGLSLADQQSEGEAVDALKLFAEMAVPLGPALGPQL